MTGGAQPNLHLETGEVASYLDRALAPDEQARVEAHLADCADCRRELIEVSRLRHARFRSRWWVLGPALAAAAAALLFVTRSPDTPATEPVLRDGGEPALTIGLVAPGDSAVSPGSLTFTWRSAAPRASYRLTLSDERGDVVWSATSIDTTQRPPSRVSWRTGRTYFWYVDALLPDGRSVTSGVRRFTVR